MVSAITNPYTHPDISDALSEAASNVFHQLDQGIVHKTDLELFNRLLINSTVPQSFVESLIPAIDQAVKAPDYYETDPDFVLIAIYETLLSKLPPATVLEYYPIHFITENIQYANQFSLLILKIITRNHSQIELVSNGLLHTILSLYLKDADVMIPIASAIQNLVLVLSDDHNIISELNTAKFKELFANAKTSGDSVLISRLLDLMVVLAPAVQFDLGFPIGGDVLLDLLKIDFYQNLINKENTHIFEAISTPVNRILALYNTRTTDAEIESFLATEIANLIASITFAFPDWELPGLKSYNLYLDLASDVLLLSKINPAKFDDDLLEFVVDYSLFSTKYFRILLNLVKSQKALHFLVQHDKITASLIKNLSLDMLFDLLVELTSTDFGVHYLLNSLPSIVTDFIINDSAISSDVYIAKLEVFEHLLFQDHDLTIWNDQLVDAYKLMKNGRNIRHEARVEIADEAV
ncbi:DNA mismatch repair protein [Yamadazyma tenuis]|nr:uncharacterized protein CANTEDRAFT_113574 [Yamadazyma tenuis ATCC 10573]EGV65136.1 hypothetical protein CANTEDRAFT_113574 [Yamadazyma tenuis ATCC 10573]WEJ97597.1 DNA mismatch repair protein [Yamadazyma tenuis]